MDLLSEKADELGLDAVAVTSVEPFFSMKPLLEDMHASNRYPAFVEPEVELRIHPSRLLSTAKSLVTAAIGYQTVEPNAPREPRGKLSRYAWGLDYHSILYSRLDALAQWLCSEYHAKDYYVAVDTKPLIDRAVAERASLGWLGRNCSIFVPPYGSWVFLGEILIDVQLPFTKPTSNYRSCPDGCQRCIQACPTKALYAPYRVNPHICISYLTQMKGLIPRKFRAALGRNLWGCDVCQEVCPHNAITQPCRHQAFQPREGTDIPLLPLLSISKREFRQRFGSTAIGWRGRGVLQRNAAIILGNLQHEDAVEPLGQCLKDPKSVVRASAAWALGRIGGSRATELVWQARTQETDPAVCDEMDIWL